MRKNGCLIALRMASRCTGLSGLSDDQSLCALGSFENIFSAVC